MQSCATFDCWGSHLSASLFLPERVSVFLRERDGDGETGQECPGYGSGAFLALLDENLFAGWEPESGLTHRMTCLLWFGYSRK